MLMLQDDSGEISTVRLDPSLANSDNAIIVLDEYSDTCWVWIGRNVNMPTRMHCLRMGKGFQKSGHKVGVTTIGMASTNLVEMMEKDDSDPEVANNIVEFRTTITKNWKFDDGVLAYDEGQSKGYAAVAPTIIDSVPASSTPSESTPFVAVGTSTPEPFELVAETIEPEPVQTDSLVSSSIADKKAAYLLLSAVKNADLVYTERFDRDGMLGVKIEAPGVMVIEVLMDGDKVTIDPPDFGDTEGAMRIKTDYESWLKSN
ncbi:MAG: hypothetical protein ACW97A_02120 [Candidatus Thorarchaeota archaeon]|jgi:hypothetical protein